MSIETEHRGYTIRYNDNAGAWYCSDLSLEAPQLPALRDKINQTLAKEARMSAPAIWLRGGYDRRERFTECTVTSIASDLDYHKRPQVWISYSERGRTKRTKISVADLAPESDEAKAAIQAAKEAREKEERAARAASAAHDAIPRLSLKDIQAQKVEAESDAS